MSQSKPQNTARHAGALTIDGVPVLTRPAKTHRPKAAVRICNSSTRTGYTGNELSTPCLRANADDSLALPSRMGDRLRYRDGYLTDMHGTPITTGA